MPVSPHRLHRFGRWSLIVLNLIVAALLVLASVLIYLERGWSEPRFAAPEDAFHDGTIGTELMPLPVAVTLPGLFPEHFQPAGRDAGDWVEQFGFLKDPDDPEGLPIGFATTHYRPQSAAPSPVPFVGFSCALCHTTEIKTEAHGPGTIVTGPGSVSLNLFAWIDAFQAALIARQPLADGEVLDPLSPPPYRLSVADIDDAWARETGAPLAMAERLMVQLWLGQIRGRIEDGLPRFDEPYGNGRSRDVEVAPTGPTRTLAFRTLVRNVLDRPGNDLPIHTKIATIYSQQWRPRAQFDGSIADLNARSSMAAFAAGATVVNMQVPEIAHNIRAASAYTTTLRAPEFDELFPSAAPVDDGELARGRAVYHEHCLVCHGDRQGADAWDAGPRMGSVIPLSEIGTDPERVMFRHYGELPGRLHALFPHEHPFAFDRDTIYPRPGEEDDLAIRGYLAGPIDGAYLRAPFLHNASVLTLAELINLEPRREVFFRGRNLYDVERLGFASPTAADADHYFRFDTRAPGNAASGHDYPWAFDDPARDEAALGALLAYLRTL